MFTFLPDNYKNQAVKEYRLRLVALYLCLACIFLISGATSALPTFAIIQAEKSALTEERDSIIKNLKENPETLEKEVSSLNRKIDTLTSTLTSKSIIQILESVLSEKRDGIVIQSISLKRGGENGTITIGGVASSRDTLVAFSKRLESKPLFSHTDLPVGSFTKNKNIPFTISITSSF